MKTKLIQMCVLAACAAFEGWAMPSEEEVEKAVPKVERMLSSEKVALESGKMKRGEVAAAAMKLAAGVNDEAAKLLLMKGAFVLHVKDGNLEKAVETMNALETAIADVPPQVVTNIIETALLGLPDKNDGARLYRLLDAGKVSPQVGFGGSKNMKAVVNGYTWSYSVRNGEATIVSPSGKSGECAISPKPTGDVTIPSTLGGAKVTSIGNSAFAYCREMKSVMIPNSVTNIGFWAFYQCWRLPSVIIPEGVISIQGLAFEDCWHGLTSVTIPSTVTNIGWCAFAGNGGKLTAFDVSLANPKYASVKGILCSKDGKTVIAGVNGDVKIPEGVTSIGNGAFHKYSGLISVEIPESVKNIGKEAFSNCMKLESVTMRGEKPDSGDKVFTKCDKLKSIHVPANCKSWAGMKEWQGIPLVFDGDQKEVPTAAIDEYTWSYSVKNGEATVVSMKNGRAGCAVSPKPTGNVVIPSTLGGAKVTSIGQAALAFCSDLASVTIPGGVKDVGTYAFGKCAGLKSVTIPASVTVIGNASFCYCSKLDSVTLPKDVVSILDFAFIGCIGLKTIEIPEHVRNIGKRAFYECTGLTSVTMRGERPDAKDEVFAGCTNLKAIHVPASCKSWAGMKEWQGIPLAFDADKVERLSATIDGYTWSYSVKNGEATIIPEGKDKCAVSPKPTGAFSIPGTLGGAKVTAIGRRSFSGCKGMTSVKIPEGVTSIGEGAFGDCRDLTSVSMPSNLVSLGDYAFGSCSGLKSVEIPASVRELKTQVFLGCTGLESVTIPAGVERIGWASFGYCNALKEIRVDEGNRCFTSVDGVLYTKDRTELVACPDTLSEISILPEVRNIGQCAFLGCYKLTNLTIPEGVTNIAWQGVKDCPAIKAVTIPSTVRSIATIAFCNCRSLTTVTIPQNMTSFGDRVFSSCGSLVSVTMLGDRPTFGKELFKDCSKLKTIRVQANEKGWTGMKDWQGVPLVFE